MRTIIDLDDRLKKLRDPLVALAYSDEELVQKLESNRERYLATGRGVIDPDFESVLWQCGQRNLPQTVPFFENELREAAEGRHIWKDVIASKIVDLAARKLKSPKYRPQWQKLLEQPLFCTIAWEALISGGGDFLVLLPRYWVSLNQRESEHMLTVALRSLFENAADKKQLRFSIEAHLPNWDADLQKQIKKFLHHNRHDD